MDEGDSRWSQKGATMSDKSARQEFGLTQQEIIAAIRAGKLQFRDDIYGLDAKIASILRGGERQVADIAIERPADPNFKPTAEQNARLRAVAGGGISSPFALFERVFR